MVIANPNAPTGILLPLEEIEWILQANADNIVIIDEAYIDFSKNGSSAVGLIGRYENLLVIRTFSKSVSFAGIRVGYAVDFFFFSTVRPPFLSKYMFLFYPD